jgi:hypothetical protein
MYKNPFNYGDLSDYNSLKNQKNIGEIINKLKKTDRKTKPTELQKYYEYLTYQQPILDELNFIAEKQRFEDLTKQKADFDFLQNIKQDRENKMKELVDINEPKTDREIIKNELFYEPKPFNTKIDDLTPLIQSQNELIFEVLDKKENDIRREGAEILDIDIGKIKKNQGLLLEYNNDLFDEPMILERRKDDDYKEKAKKKLEEVINNYGISTDLTKINPIKMIKDNSKKIKKSVKEINTDIYNQVLQNTPIRTDLQTSSIISQADTSLENIPRNKRGKGGRKKGSKNKSKGKTLDLT